MPIKFKLDHRAAGYVVAVGAADQKVQVCYRELIGPDDASHLQRRLEGFHTSVFGKIPGLPSPSAIDHLLVVVQPDLECTAYVNELSVVAEVRTTGPVQKGAPVYVSDISDVTSIDLGVDVPPDCGVLLFRTTGWRRSLFFDLGPILPECGSREYSLQQVLAQQALLLLGIPSGLPEATGRSSADATQRTSTRLQVMQAGLDDLRSLLQARCEEESKYQEVLCRHPWMLGGFYSDVARHQPLDDRNIPDLTAVRCYDRCHDVVELKQPFLPLFRRDRAFTADFNNAWNQAERYLAFATQQRSYLRDEKELRFENPRCILILGNGLSEGELREIRKKESFVRSISVFTYDHLIETASHIVSLMSKAHEQVVPGSSESLANLSLKLTGF